ncbi:MAG TPA: response regulator, partial [Calditrichia bacterium]|nr:response regulator [Calditrichia bacterium]
GIEFLVEILPEVPDSVEGDPERIKQVLINLCSNAVKFTEKGFVHLKVSHLKGQGGIRFDIRDTGIGIQPDRLASLFDSFVQADASTTRKYGGTGLGLTIARRLTEAMGGRIGVESEPGLGSLFWLELNLPPGAAPQGAERLKTPKSVRNMRMLIVDDLSLNREILKRQLAPHFSEIQVASDARAGMESLKKAAQDGAPFDVCLVDYHMPGMDGMEFGQWVRRDPAFNSLILILLTAARQAEVSQLSQESGFLACLFKPLKVRLLTRVLGQRTDAGRGREIAPEQKVRFPAKRILIAEDNRVNQMVAQKALERLGFVVEIVENGEMVLNVLRDKNYDLILMDIQMPVMGGEEATRKIREGESGEGNRDIPIIAITANALAGDREKYLASGMNGYLSKPFKRQELADCLREVLKLGDL